MSSVLCMHGVVYPVKQSKFEIMSSLVITEKNDANNNLVWIL